MFGSGPTRVAQTPGSTRLKSGWTPANWKPSPSAPRLCGPVANNVCSGRRLRAAAEHTIVSRTVGDGEALAGNCGSGALGVAALQFLGLAQYAVHGIFLAYKWGYDPPMLTAGTEALMTFLLLSGVAAGAGAVAWWRLRLGSPKFARCAKIATLTLLAGAVGCLAIIASPLVDLVQR